MATVANTPAGPGRSSGLLARLLTGVLTGRQRERAPPAGADGGDGHLPGVDQHRPRPRRVRALGVLGQSSVPCGGRSAVEAAVAAFVEDERFAVMVLVEVMNAGDDDHMVAGRVLGLDRAFDPGQRAVEDRAAA